MKLAAAFLSATLVSASAPAPRQVEIVGVDYAFKLPQTLAPGLTTFRFRNEAQHPHEFNVFLLKPGVTIDQVIKAGVEGKSQMQYIETPVGVLFAGKGETSRTTLTTNLLPGRVYGIQCIFRDSAKAPTHYSMGMYGSIRITQGTVSKTPKADSIIAVDYAYSSYPHAMSPGRHSLAFRNAGQHRHEMNITLLKPGITIDTVIAYDKRKADVEPLFDNDGGVLHSRPGETAAGLLDIDFLPGREYLLACGFQDDDKSPPHYVLGMYGSIRVPSR